MNRANAHTNACTQTYTHAHTHAHTQHTHMHARTHIHARTHARAHTQGLSKPCVSNLMMNTNTNSICDKSNILFHLHISSTYVSTDPPATYLFMYYPLSLIHTYIYIYYPLTIYYLFIIY